MDWYWLVGGGILLIGLLALWGYYDNRKGGIDIDWDYD